MHGKQSQIKVDTETLLFSGCSQSILAARYHSLAADADTIPDSLYVTASTKDGEIMAVQHKEYPIYSVQFHPESVMTQDGYRLLANWLKVCGQDNAVAKSAGLQPKVTK